MLLKSPNSHAISATAALISRSIYTATIIEVCALHYIIFTSKSNPFFPHHQALSGKYESKSKSPSAQPSSMKLLRFIAEAVP